VFASVRSALNREGGSRGIPLFELCNSRDARAFICTATTRCLRTTYELFMRPSCSLISDSQEQQRSHKCAVGEADVKQVLPRMDEDNGGKVFKKDFREAMRANSTGWGRTLSKAKREASTLRN
jgi:hypothetical protein